RPPLLLAPKSLRFHENFQDLSVRGRSSTPTQSSLSFRRRGGGIFLAAIACFAAKPCSSADIVCGRRNVARQAHNRQCRRNANRSWMDRENARARARPRAEQ